MLNSRLYYGKLQYKIQWIGFDKDDEWYPAQNLISAPHKVRDYHIEYPRKPGPPKNLAAWIKAWEDGKEYTTTEEDDWAETRKGEHHTR